MPTLEWLCKDKVVNHHLDVPYRILERKYSFDAAGTRAEDVGSENMIVHGDNLEALKALLPRYEGRVKCVYIDPPYNTGEEKWKYNDAVNDPRIRKWLHQAVGKEGDDLSRHEKWLCMMYPRLRLLHKLLADDGVIFISIDDNEFARLKSICDEIFGTNCFIANIVWQKRTSPDSRRNLGAAHDFILCYSKTPAIYKKLNKIAYNAKRQDSYKNLDNDPRGAWASVDLTGQVGHATESQFYGIPSPSGKLIYPPSGRCWAFAEKTMLSMIADNRIWFGKTGNSQPRQKRFLSEMDGAMAWTWWSNTEVGHNQEATKELNNIMGQADVFDTPKPTRLIERILQIATGPNDIILDSFAGSGTTAHAVLNLNKADGGKRRFILVEMEDYADSITAERVKRVIQGYPTKEEKTLYDEEITPKNLASGAELLERAKTAAQEAKDSGLYEKISKPQIKDGRLQVVATLKAEVSAQGTGGDFSFYELGAPLLVDERLNPSAPLEKIREYIWFTETKTPFSPVADDNEYYLGTFNDAAYYFYYKSDETTTLDAAFLASVKSKNDITIVYADRCAVDAKKLKRLGVVFKKIPRDINGR